MSKKPFSPAENHSYNVNVAVCLKHTGKAVLLKEFVRSFRHWRDHGGEDVDGFSWFFIRMDKLSTSYPEYSPKSMYRWIKELEDNYLIASRSDLNKHGYDKTRWFTVNEEAYERLVLGDDSVLCDSQNENTGQFSKWAIAILKMRTAILKMGNSNSQNETTIQPCINPSVEPCAEPSSETDVSLSLFGELHNDSVVNDENVTMKEEKNSAKKEEKAKREAQMVEDAVYLIGVLNQFAGRSFPSDPKGRGSKNVDYAVSLLRKKYSVNELELMVQFKCFEWVGNSKMEKYLQPVTLFKRHGEDYVQEAIEAKDNPAFLAAVRRAKEAEAGGQKGSGLNTADSYTRQVANSLQNW